MSGVKLFHVTLPNEKTINCPFYMFSGDGAYLFDNKVKQEFKSAIFIKDISFTFSDPDEEVLFILQYGQTITRIVSK
jgi:hypothetical protein